jgi:hypothetical protein
MQQASGHMLSSGHMLTSCTAISGRAGSNAVNPDAGATGCHYSAPVASLLRAALRIHAGNSRCLTKADGKRGRDWQAKGMPRDIGTNTEPYRSSANVELFENACADNHR